MKIDFLPKRQMAYTDLYGDCTETLLDPHVDPNCHALYVGELGRISEGAWIHEDYYPTLIADPTDAALWTAGITDGSIFLVKELNGTYDGGTPKVVPGYGRVKEFTSGYDYTAVLKDRVYIENYQHYKTLSTTSVYHLAYKTQTQIRITDVPVSVSVKDPIGDSVDDYVIWEATAKWFQQFASAPHTMPAGIF